MTDEASRRGNNSEVSLDVLLIHRPERYTHELTVTGGSVGGGREGHESNGSRGRDEEATLHEHRIRGYWV